MDEQTSQPKQIEKNTLPDEAIEIAKEVIVNFRIVMSNLKIYPISSQIITNSLSTTYNSISRFIEQNDTLVFAHSNENIIINGNPILTRRLPTNERFTFETFLNMFGVTHIRSLSFKKGLTLEELALFLPKLTDKNWRQVGDVKILTELLDKEGITHISINEWEYEAVGESDLILEKAKDYIDKKGTSLDEFMQSLDEAAKMHFSTEDTALREQSRTAIAEKLMKLSPDIFMNFFQERCEGDIEKLKTEVISGLPADNVKELVIKMAKLYLDFRRDIKPGDKREYELLRLKDSINSFLTACKNKNIFIEICNELIKMDLKELVPDFWQHPELSEIELAVAQAKLLVEKDSLAIIEDDAQEKLPDILKELDVMNRTDLLTGLVGKVIQNLDANVSGIRFRNARLVKHIIPTIELLKHRGELQYIYGKILKAVDREPDMLVYNELSDTLIKKIIDYLKGGDYQSADNYIDTYRRHRREENKGFIQRPHHADKIMATIVDSEVTSILVSDLKQQDKEKRNSVMKVMAQFEDMATPALIRSLKEIPDYSIRNNMAVLIRYLGKTTVSSLIEELSLEHDETAIVRMIEILPSIEMDEAVIERLSALIFHPSNQVRLSVVRAVSRLKLTDKAGELLLSALREKEDYIKREIINALGDIRCVSALESLHEIINVKSIFGKETYTDVIQQAACSALGKIKDGRSIQPLLELVKKYAWYTFRLTKKDMVRISGISAIKNFDTSATNIKSVLGNLIKCKSQFIKAAAESVLIIKS